MQVPAVSSINEIPSKHLDPARETKLGFVNQLMHLFDRLFGEVDTPAYQIGLLSRYRIKSHIYTAKSNEIHQMSNLHGEAAIHQILLESNEHVQRTDRKEEHGQQRYGQRLGDPYRPSPYTQNSKSGRDEHPSPSATTETHSEESPPALGADTASDAGRPQKSQQLSTISYSSGCAASRSPLPAHQKASRIRDYSRGAELDAQQQEFSSCHFSSIYADCSVEEVEKAEQGLRSRLSAYESGHGAMQASRSSPLAPIAYRPSQSSAQPPEDAAQKELDDLLDLWAPQGTVE